MLQLLLFVLLAIIKVASSTAQNPVYLQLTDEAYRECDEQAIEVVEELARYYCRDVQYYDPSTTQHKPEDAMDRLLYLGKYAYRGYTFLEDEKLPKPALLQPQEALLMMRACLLQNAAATFHYLKVDSNQLVNRNDCAEEVMQQEFDTPLEEAERVFRTLNKNTMRSLPQKRSHCMEQVLSSFAREWIMGAAVVVPPKSGIGFGGFLKGKCCGITLINMNSFDEGVEWLSMWIMLNTWKEGVVKGWTVLFSQDLPLPYVRIYYVAQKSWSH